MDALPDIGFTEEQIDLLSVASAFCRDKSPMDKVRALMNDEPGYDPAVWQEIVDLGWLGIAVPEVFGGVGLSMTEVVPVMEQMGRYSLMTPFMSTTIAAQVILKAGTQVQKDVILPQIVGGKIVSLALAEPGGDWAFKRPAMTAIMTGEHIRLSGQKIFTEYLPQSDYVIVNATLDQRAALFILPSDIIPDDAIRREEVIDETKRSYGLTLDGLSVPKSSQLDPSQTHAGLEFLHLCATLLGSAEMVGGTQAVIDYTLDYLQTRQQFGKLIGAFQALKHPIVDAYIDYEKSRSLLYTAALCFGDQGQGEIATRMVKAQADKAFSFAADRAIQFHGGFGFTYDCDAQLYRRRAIWHAAQHGDAAYHRTKLADLLLS